MKSFSCSCLGKVFSSNSLQICYFLFVRSLYFFALLFTSHRSPLSERLEQASSCEQFCSLEIKINFFFFFAKLNLPSRVNFVQLSFNFKVSNTHLVTKAIDFSHKNWLSLLKFFGSKLDHPGLQFPDSRPF